MSQDFLIYSILGAFTLLLGFVLFQVLKLKKRLDVFLRGGDKDLEGVLKDLVEKSKKGEKDIQKIFAKLSQLEKIAKISFQKIGVVRYNPFKSVGGNQSFSIALLDSQNSGFVITSLYMKEENRIFAKPIIKGKSEYSLSEEEKKAIEQAVSE